jgi:hypothetical protein
MSDMDGKVWVNVEIGERNEVVMGNSFNAQSVAEAIAIIENMLAILKAQRGL